MDDDRERLVAEAAAAISLAVTGDPHDRLHARMCADALRAALAAVVPSETEPPT